MDTIRQLHSLSSPFTSQASAAIRARVKRRTNFFRTKAPRAIAYPNRRGFSPMVDHPFLDPIWN